MRDDFDERCKGRWAQIMMQLGMGFAFLNPRRNGPCPMCGGKDRWRFSDHNDDGGWVCNHCGRGYGLDLVMVWKGAKTRVEAMKLVEAVIGGPPTRAPRTVGDPGLITKQKARMAALWGKGYALDGADIASRYLKRRLSVAPDDYPSQALRWAADVPYWGEKRGEALGYYAVMLARFIAPDDSAATLQRLWLDEPGEKAKAPVVKPRTMMPGPIPEGGAVRLGAAAEVMGVAEGVESAIGASLCAREDLHRDIPVWAALSAGSLQKFVPPPECKMLYVFEDYDPSHTGEAVAGSLAHRLVVKNKIGAEVMLKKGPAGDGVKWDWADEWAARQFHRRGGKIRFRG